MRMGGGREDSSHATGGNLHEAAPGCMGLHETAWGNSMEVTRNAKKKNVKQELPCDMAILFLGAYPKTQVSILRAHS